MYPKKGAKSRKPPAYSPAVIFGAICRIAGITSFAEELSKHEKTRFQVRDPEGVFNVAGII
jgi:hypothetical protein